MNRRGFLSRLLAAGAGVVLAPVIEKVIPKPTDKPIGIEDLEAMVNKWCRDAMAEFNKWCFQDGDWMQRNGGVHYMWEAFDAPPFGSVKAKRVKIDTILPPSE